MRETERKEKQNKSRNKWENKKKQLYEGVGVGIQDLERRRKVELRKKKY